MPIVDISGFSASEAEAKAKIRKRIKEYYRARLGISLGATTVTFITDESAGEGPEVHVMARLYSKMFMAKTVAELNMICDEIVAILEKEGGHEFNEAFPIPVLTMRGGTKPYRPSS